MTPGNLSEQVTAAPDGAGAVRSLGETFTPDPQTGTGRYHILFPLQAGPAGITPSLALVYTTTGGNGVAGLGWDLGLAAIRRRTDHGIPTYDDRRDRFALLGDELIAQGGTSYRFRVEGRFARIRRQLGRGSDAWVVTERDGTRTFYGEVAEARLASGAGQVAAWYVTRKQDVHGNEVIYQYERDAAAREVRLRAIDWAGCYRVALNWEARPDPVVSARAGFPTRLESRVRSIELQAAHGETSQFHTLRRYDLRYGSSRWTGRSLLIEVAATAFDTDGAARALPPLTFRYGDAELSRARWHAVGGDHPGESLSSRDVTLLRCSGSGLPDLLETRPTGHVLRVNAGGGRFASPRAVPAPALVALSDPGTFLSDMDGDGYVDLVVQGGRRVYAAVAGAGGWGKTYALTQPPSVNLDSRDVRLADFTGNGLPDAIRSGVSGWWFFENAGDGRWAPPALIRHAPSLRLDDVRVHLADMDGDGLADLVYVDASGVTVWPSLGRGRFGAGYRLSGAPRFGTDFDPKKVRFVDLTGSGQADLLYVRDGVAHVAFNRSGVALSPLTEVGRAPLTSRGFVEVTDLLGTGTPGLLYTDEGHAWRFLELFTAGPLDLLTSIDNGVGATTTIVHGTSAAHWARDAAAGRPWRTQMPTAQRVVDRITTSDAVTGTVLEVSLQYAHGVYDGREREFRGFARVTQLDREAPADDPLPIAQAKAVRWYHTGDRLDLRDEWFPIPGNHLEDEVPDHPWARRALRGLLRREETYALDGHRQPYRITETAYQAFTVGTPSDGFRSAWTPLAIRSRSTTLERTTDVRQSEVLTTYDLNEGSGRGYGLPIEVREIGHGRRGTFATSHEQQQTETLERFTRTAYIHLDQPEPAGESAPYVPSYVVGNAALQERFVVTGAGDALVARCRWFYDGEAYRGLGYPGSGTVAAITKGSLSCRLELAFTAPDFDAAYPAGSGAASARDERGSYLLDGGDYYVHAERMAYAANGLPIGSLDANGHETTVEYDARHRLFAVRVTEPLVPPTVLERATLPFRLAAIVDSNGNRTEFTYDPAGWPASKTVMGKKVAGEWQGDPPTHPTAAYEYDFGSLPIRITTRIRQTRLGSTLDSHTYRDGFGRTVQERRTAEPDPSAPDTPRFRVTGAGLFNHKGLLVRAFQPTFSPASGYAPASTSVPFVETMHDPLGRPIRVNFPDGTCETIDYHPWVQTAKDRNDNADATHPPAPQYLPYLAAFQHHVDTPTRRFVDAFGRVVAVAADNGSEVHVTRKVLDSENRVIEIWDARGLAAPTWVFDYDRAGRHIRTRHLTALGDRRSLADAGGNPIWALDARGIEVLRYFDALNRPVTETSLEGGRLTPRRQWRYVASDENEAALASHQSRNLFGQVEEQRDADGVRFFEYDWRGLVTRTTCRFWAQQDTAGRAWDDPASELWTAGAGWDAPIPEGDRDEIDAYLELPDLTDSTTVTIETAYDAAGRPTESSYPEGMRIRRRYNPAGLLGGVDVDRGTAAGYEPVLAAIAYSARGQMTRLTHGNGVETIREYDAAVERLTRIVTRRLSLPSTIFQDLSYAYDPAGNLLVITDNLSEASLPGQIAPNTRTFGYDPRYRLIRATGRRHRTAANRDIDVLVPTPDPGDYEPYTASYGYDAVGNCTRNEEYAAGSLSYKAGRVDLFNGDETEAAESTDPEAGSYRYDANGNTTRTPRHAELAYSHDNQVRYVALGGGEQVRDLRHGDQRVLRLVNRSGGNALSVYVGPFEYHLRRGDTGYTKLTLQLRGAGRHAQAERLLAGVDPTSVPLFFHHADHLDSGHVITAGDGSFLSQEEYFPYGRASDRRDARNRYRFVGVERDEDTHLCVTGPRTYDPVCGRFLQGDPLTPPEHATAPFVYGEASPVGHADPSGYQPVVLPGPEGPLLNYLELYQEFFAQGMNPAMLDAETGLVTPGAPFSSQSVTHLARQTLEAPLAEGGFGIPPGVSNRVLYTVSDPLVSRELGGPFSVIRRPTMRTVMNNTLTPPPRLTPAPLRTPTLPGPTGGAPSAASAVVRTPTLVPEAAPAAVVRTPTLVPEGVATTGESVAQGVVGGTLRTTLTGLATGLGIGLLGAAQHNDISHEPEFVLSLEFLNPDFWDPTIPAGDLVKWERNPNYHAQGNRNNDAAAPSPSGAKESPLP